MTSPLCVATGGWCRRVFHYRPPTPMYRNSPPLCTIVLQIPSLMPLKMRKVQFGVCTKSKDGRNVTVGPNDAALRRHRTWMATSAATKVYKLRKQVVEPVFGIIKEQQGGRRFLLRGLTNVAAEWTVLATAFNLRTLCRVWRARIFDRVFGQSQCPSPWPPEPHCGW